MNELNENLLDAWLGVSAAINNDRIVHYLPYNEALICNLIWKQKLKSDECLTATKLCESTGIIRSLMNRTLNSLEEKGMIERERSKGDKRIVYLRLSDKGEELFLKEHESNMKIISLMVEKVGEDKAKEILLSLNLISEVAREIILDPEKR